MDFQQPPAFGTVPPVKLDQSMNDSARSAAFAVRDISYLTRPKIMRAAVLDRL